MRTCTAAGSHAKCTLTFECPGNSSYPSDCDGNSLLNRVQRPTNLGGGQRRLHGRNAELPTLYVLHSGVHNILKCIQTLSVCHDIQRGGECKADNLEADNPVTFCATVSCTISF